MRSCLALQQDVHQRKNKHGDADIAIHVEKGYIQFRKIMLPNQGMLVDDQDKRDAWKIKYDFNVQNRSTQGMPRVGDVEPFEPFDEEDAEAVAAFTDRDTPKGEFAESAERAKREFASTENGNNARTPGSVSRAA